MKTPNSDHDLWVGLNFANKGVCGNILSAYVNRRIKYLIG